MKDFRSTPHLAWVSVLLLAAILAQWAFKPNADLILSYLSFAATVASLILAILAIVYTFFSNSHLLGTSKQISDVTSLLESESGKLKRVADAVEARTDSLEDALASMPKELSSLREDLEGQFEKLTKSSLSTSTSRKSDEKHYSLFKREGTVGTDFAHYLLAKSFETGYSFELEKVFSSGAGITKNFVFGVLQAVALLEPRGIKIEYAGDSFRTVSSGSWDYEKILNDRDNIDANAESNSIQQIDDYFDSLVSHRLEKDEIEEDD